MTLTHPNVTLYACIVSIGGFVFGFDAVVIGGVVGYVSSQFDLEPWQIGLVVTAPTFAAIASSFTIGIISDLIGRKRTLLFLAALYLVSALLSAGAYGFWGLVIARGIGGYAFGALTQAPVYISEIAPAHSRGRLVAINQLTIVAGISAAYFSNLVIQMYAEHMPVFSEEPWRVMLGVEALPALAWLIGMLLVPESPRWLATQARWAEVEAVFKRLGGIFSMAEEMNAIREDVGSKMLPFRQRFMLLFSRGIWFALLIGLILAIVQQITGINTVYFYAPVIFEQSGVGTDAAFSQAVFVGIINIVFTLISMALIDRLGRRPLIIAGLTGVIISMSLVSWGFHSATYVLDAAALEALPESLKGQGLAALADTSFASDMNFKTAVRNIIGSDALRDNESALLAAAMNGNSRLILLGILGFVASFAVSLGPVMWVYLSEIYPNQVRGIAISLVTVFNSGASALVQFLFPIQLANSGIAGVFAGYAVFGFIGLVLIIWLMPETKQLALEDITRIMANRGRREKRDA